MKTNLDLTELKNVGILPTLTSLNFERERDRDVAVHKLLMVNCWATKQ